MGNTIADTNWVLVKRSETLDQKFHLVFPESNVGRSTGSDIRINDSSVSKSHARFYVESDSLMLKDLGSTNGTFINGKRVSEAKVSEGDLVQFANLFFRLEIEGTPEIEMTMEEVSLDQASKLVNFDRLMSERAVRPLYQPIVNIRNNRIIAYEMLACSDIEHLETAADVFETAKILNQQVALSEMLREEGARIANESANSDKRYFFNIDPTEFGTQRLNESLVMLREKTPNLALTLEVHEKAVAQLDVLRNFRETLQKLDIELAYDDFGAGQGRLLELTEVPPDVVKFDMRLIRDIDTASSARLELMRSLVRAATECGSLALAECVETQSEHEVCVDLGFHLGQGYYYGHPTNFA